MTARAMWKGVLRFDEMRVPVKLYAAVEDRTVHFHLLHAEDLVRIKQRMAHPESGETVPPERTRKGFEVERNVLVVLDDEDLEALRPEASREIRITRFVDPHEITHQWYVRPYFLGPDGDDERYFAMKEALARTGKEGVARWVMRGKRYAGALRVVDGHLGLNTLHHVEEVVSRGQLEAPEGRQPTRKERELADTLVDALAGDFDPDDYRDQYRERVRQLIDAKRGGEPVPVVEAAEEAPSAASLKESLEASLARAS